MNRFRPEFPQMDGTGEEVEGGVSSQIHSLLWKIGSPTFIVQAIPFRRSLKLHKARFAGVASPFNFLAPSLRFGPKRSLALAKASFTNSLLPITAPSVK